MLQGTSFFSPNGSVMKKSYKFSPKPNEIEEVNSVSNSSEKKEKGVVEKRPKMLLKTFSSNTLESIINKSMNKKSKEK